MTRRGCVGGRVIGAPGHNAAHEAIERLRAGEYS